MKRIWINIKSFTRRLQSINDKPLEIAKGYALGIFLATTPFVGLKVFIALILSALFRWSKTASVVGVYHINPVTAPPFYGISFLVGKSVLGINAQFVIPEHCSITSMFHLFAGAGQIFMSLLAGGLILGIPLTFIAYLSVRRVLVNLHRVHYSS